MYVSESVCVSVCQCVSVFACLCVRVKEKRKEGLRYYVCERKRECLCVCVLGPVCVSMQC